MPMPFRTPFSRFLIVLLVVVVIVQTILLLPFYTGKATTNTNDFLWQEDESSHDDINMVSDVANAISSEGHKSLRVAQDVEKTDESKLNLRELTFDDLILGEHISSGSCNIAIEVKLPDWWHQQQKIIQLEEEKQWQTESQRRQNEIARPFYVDESTDLVVKIAKYADWGDLEILALNRLHADKFRAAKHKIMPLIWGGETFDNPFYEGENGDERPQRKLPEQLAGLRRSLRRYKTISALVIPNLETLGQMESMSKLRKLEDLSVFMRSLFKTLEYANSVGVNNNDMTGNNLKVDSNGEAILIDWNGMHLDGENIYEEDAAFEIVPPEGFFEKVPVVKKDGDGEVVMKSVKQTSVGSYDVWTAGIRFANQIFAPCRWVYTGSENSKYNLRENIRAIGGNSEILVNYEGDKSDLAPLAGLDPKEVPQSSFRPALCRNRAKPCAPCDADSFSVLDSSSKEMKAKALDFLENMMRIAPQDRPTATELLKHPFLN